MSKRMLIFIVGGDPVQALSDIPKEFLETSENEVVWLQPASGAGPREVPRVAARIRCFKVSGTGGVGGDIKLVFRYAREKKFKKILVVGGEGKQLTKMAYAQWRGLDSVQAVFCLEKAWEVRALGRGVPVSGIMGIRTSLLDHIPFERNSRDNNFFADFVKQCQIANVSLKGVISPGIRRWCPGFFFSGFLSSMHHKLHQAGFFYDRKFDLGEHHYPVKRSPHSSHSMVEKAISKGSRVLDLGCGKGMVAEGLVAKGCVVDGVDVIDQEQTSSCLRNYYQIDLNKNRQELARVLRNETYDVILMADIIEHLIDPEQMLEMIRDNQPMNGACKVIVCTGNVAFFIVRSMLALGQFNYGPRGILDRTHTRLFTRKSFDQIFRQAGYDITKKQWIPMPLSTILGDNFILHFAEWVNKMVAKIRPGLFSYQMLFTVVPHPTTEKLLASSQEVLYESYHREKKVPLVNLIPEPI